MQNKMKKGLALGLCVCLAFSALTGCSKKKEPEVDHTAALLTLEGGDSISEGAANMLMRYEQAEFESGFGAFIKSYYGDIWNSDLTGTGQAYGNIFKENIMSEMQEMLLAKAHMDDYGVSLSDDQTKAIKAAAEAFISSNDETVLGKMSATTESVEEMLTLYTIRSMMENEMTADVNTEVSDEEAAQRTVSYIYFSATPASELEEETEDLLSEASTETAAEETSEAMLSEETEVRTQSADAEAVSEAAVEEAAAEESEMETEPETESPEMIEAREAALAKAEAFLEEAKNADDFAAKAQEAAGADETAYASSYTFGDGDSYPSAEIIEATKGLDDNTLVDYVVVSGTNYYVLHVDDAFDEDATEDKKVEIVEQRKNEQKNALYDEWREGASFTTDDAAFAALLFDFSLMAETEDETEVMSEIPDEEETLTEAES